MRVRILLAPFLFITGIVQAQTTIVALVSPDVIMIGVDSKVRLFASSVDTTMCKLVVHDTGTVYAMAGILGIPDTGFSTTKMVAQLLNDYRGLRFSTRIDSIAYTLHNRFESDFKIYKREYPDLYTRLMKEKFKGDRNFLTLVFATEEDGILLFGARHLNAVDTSRVTFKIGDPLGCGPCQRGHFLGGRRDAIDAWIEENGNAFPFEQETIDSLIRLQAEKTPDHVAPPVDIIQVDRSGLKWVQGKPECRVF